MKFSNSRTWNSLHLINFKQILEQKKIVGEATKRQWQMHLEDSSLVFFSSSILRWGKTEHFTCMLLIQCGRNPVSNSFSIWLKCYLIVSNDTYLNCIIYCFLVLLSESKIFNIFQSVLLTSRVLVIFNFPC